MLYTENKKSYSKLAALALLMAFAVVIIGGCGGNETAEEQPADRAAAESSLKQYPSLQEKLDARKGRFEKTASDDMQDAFARWVEDIRATGIEDQALNVGDTAFMFSLPNAYGEPVSLESILADGPVVLTWYRGGWCPYCNMELKALQEALPEIRKQGAELVAITPEVPDRSVDVVDSNQLEFEVLSDVGNKVGKKYGIVFKLPDEVASIYDQHIQLEKYNQEKSNELPMPVTYVIDRDGVIRYAFIDADYTRRAEPNEIIAVLTEM